jgi:hypothetical protein
MRALLGKNIKCRMLMWEMQTAYTEKFRHAYLFNRVRKVMGK